MKIDRGKRQGCQAKKRAVQDMKHTHHNQVTKQRPPTNPKLHEKSASRHSFKHTDNPTGPDRRKPELLAPAGTIDAFFAALDAGADAVYVGCKDFNARALAKNFTLEEIADMQAICREKGKKLFIAMNSLLKEDELGRSIATLAWLDAIRTDGLIIQDIGLWRIARKHFPDIRLHASTLMGFHNSYGVKQAAHMGFSRVVLAREMTLREISAAVSADRNTEIEVFVHGALCYTYSGLCLFSSFFGGKSSTRGRCVQPCRRRYVQNSTPGRFFSMSDLCGIDVIQNLADIGVASLKIEGRLKPPHYVATVVKAYRLALDAPKGDEKALEEAHKMLQMAMGRQYTKGFLGQFPPKDMLQPHMTANTGQFIGKALSISSDSITIDAKVIPAKGDRLRLVCKHTDEQFQFTCLDTELIQEKQQKKHAPPYCVLKYKESGLSKAIGLKDLFVFRTDVSTQSEDVCKTQRHVLSKKELDAIRKKAELKKQQINGLLQNEFKPISQKNENRQPELWVKLSNPVRLNLVKKLRPKRIVLEITPDNLKLFTRKPPSWLENMDITLSLPPVIHEGTLSFFQKSLMDFLRKGFSSFQVANLSQIELLKDAARQTKHARGLRYELTGNYTLNLLNSQSIMAARDLGVARPQFSVESDRSNIQSALEHSPDCPSVLTIFGYLPLFTARARHTSHTPDTVIKSPQGEVLSWQPRGETAVVIHDKPYSLLRQQGYLSRLHLDSVIIDLSVWPRYKRISRKVAEDMHEFSRFFPGLDFNFTGKLD